MVDSRDDRCGRGSAYICHAAGREEEERRAHTEYRQKLKAEGGFGTLGDILKKKLGAMNSES